KDGTITLQQFKWAYDERNDDWWRERNVHLHVSHMKAEEGGRGGSGVDRLHAALARVEARRKKIIPIRPGVSPEVVERARVNNQKSMEKMRRLLAEKQEREKLNAK